MKPYFNSPEKLAALVAEAERWRGTPFRENSCVPGSRGGVSCHNLVAALYVATGAVPPFDVPRGSARRLLHNPADTMLNYIDTALAGRFAALPAGAPVLPGDMVVYREGRTAKHVAITLPGEEPHHGLRIVHVMRHSGVAYSQFNDPAYSKNLAAIRRPLLPAPES